jgi:carotenoid cleavage dioxygenase-like enzyme
MYLTLSACVQLGDLRGYPGLAVMLLQNLLIPLALLTPKLPKFSEGPVGNTALAFHEDKFLALMEGGIPFLVRLCKGVIRSMGLYTFGGQLTHPVTAHPKVDPATGELLMFYYRYESSLTYHVI